MWACLSPCIVQGCMKSGQVLTDRRFKWFEPEGWRFGDAAAADGAINYPRHASGQIYGLSGPVAKYIRRNAPILHRWLMSFEVEACPYRELMLGQHMSRLRNNASFQSTACARDWRRLKLPLARRQSVLLLTSLSWHA